jgi:DNA-3-methyladenine glycosylase II|tara:strand:+ start:1059 stop:1637 length:579 start_codon:yes stop_codon:yes gene_type:complete
LREIDGKMDKLICLYEEPALKSREDIFMTLIRSIVGQQISVKAADTVWNRLTNEIGDIIPENISLKNAENLQKCGLSHRKVEYIKGISKIWVDEYYKISWEDLSDSLVIDKLTEIRGVGVWTAEMILIFTLLRPDIFPMGDIGAIRALEKIYSDGEKMNNSQIKKITDKWSPWRTIATWYLWRSIDPEPVQY